MTSAHMGLFSGSLTYTRFFIEGEIAEDFQSKALRAIRARVMRPLEPDEEDLERSGWCRVGDPFELEVDNEHVFYNEFVNLGFRTDRWVVPTPLLKSKMREAERSYLAKKGRERMTKQGEGGVEAARRAKASQAAHAGHARGRRVVLVERKDGALSERGA